MFGTLPDDQYLARLQRQYETRHRSGVLFVGLGVLLTIGAFWGYDLVQGQVRELLAVVGGATSSDEKAKQTVDLSVFLLGFKVGGAVTGTAAAAGSMLGYGLYLLWGQRKERMILELTKKISEQKYGKVA